VTIITNGETVESTTIPDVQAWFTNEGIDITGKSLSLNIDLMGYVSSLDVDVTMTAQQITDFEEQFFNKRDQGNKGTDIASASTITLTNGNLFKITGTTTIDYITTTGWKLGSIICLDFPNDITLNHNTGSPPVNTEPLFLSDESLFDFKGGSTLTLVYDDTYWREIARMESSP